MSHWPRTIFPQPAPAAAARLRGATILWTRPEESGETMPEALAAAGATVIQAPAIEFKERGTRNLEHFLMSLDHLREWRGWLILPSPTAIRHFARLMELASLTPAALAGVRIGVIGSGSAAALEALGLTADFQPPQATGASLAETLPAAPATGVMVAGSSQSRPELQEGLLARGLRVQFIALYDTRPCAEGLRAIAQTLEKHPEALIAAASPSAAEAILDWCDQNERPGPAARWIAIGPSTGACLLERSVEPGRIGQAASPDAAGILAAAAALVECPPP